MKAFKKNTKSCDSTDGNNDVKLINYNFYKVAKLPTEIYYKVYYVVEFHRF